MRALVPTILVFACACVAVAGEDRWWELYTPAEQKKIFVEYEQYLHPDKDGNPHMKFTKAMKMFGSFKGQEGPLIKAAIAWGDLYNKLDRTKVDDRKKALSLSSQRTLLLEEIRRASVVRERGPYKVVDKHPDRMIDEYFWMLKNDSDTSQWLDMIASYGPRASRISTELRDWAVDGGPGRPNAESVKKTLDKIKKK